MVASRSLLWVSGFFGLFAVAGFAQSGDGNGPAMAPTVAELDAVLSDAEEVSSAGEGTDRSLDPPEQLAIGRNSATAGESVGIGQIDASVPPNDDVATAQIDEDGGVDGEPESTVTAEQLATYVDRCAPGAELPEGGVNCDELSLRISKKFDTTDELARALNTLDRVGRPGARDDPERYLTRAERGLLDVSPEILIPSEQAPPQQPADLPSLGVDVEAIDVLFDLPPGATIERQ